ncbi:MAG: dihydroorotate dehydrogenase [Candidatus Aerophobetes bacterium]|nr:dihydroorotate dehydrogenase [Candidatus Aerophobetes bacterium]
MDESLKVKIGRIDFENPVLVAGGTFGYGEEYSQLIDVNELGGIVTKTVTIEPREGDLPPRLAETPCGLLNAIGLENPGVEVFLKTKLPFLQKLNTRIIVNIAGEDKEDYFRVGERLSGSKGIDGLEVNISCPNVQRGGFILGTDSELVFSLVKGLKNVVDFPLIVKLTPNVTDIVEIAQAAKEGGADALSLINTLLGMAIDVETGKPKLGNITGGLSGPAIKPVAVRIVWQVFQKVDLPIIGMGGIMSAEDALEFILAGASAIAVGTANLVDPQIPLKVKEGIKEYLKKKGISSFSELIGTIN